MLAIDDPVAWALLFNLSVSLSVTRVGCAKTAGRIEVLLRIDTPGDSRSIVLDGDRHSPRREGRKFDAAFTRLPWPLVY